jgi:phosphoglycolate phosphatase-like HAD superfamily hydrolase
MWDVDQTLVHAPGVSREAYALAFAEVTHRPYEEHLIPLAGRTDLAIALDVFRANGIDSPDEYLKEFFARYAAHFHAVAHTLPLRGEVLVGAPAVMAALAGQDGVVQTLVTGNIADVARDKVTAFNLHRYLDLAIGGYGSDHRMREVLVRCCLERAAARYGQPFDRSLAMVIGDTTADVRAALAAGVVAIGVASGTTSIVDLRTAGAHAVLPDLSDIDAAVHLLSTFRLNEAG